MGGMGSGRSTSYGSRKDTVEECREIDAVRFTREKIITPDAFKLGAWLWRDARTHETRSSIEYIANTRYGTPPYLQLRYTLTKTREPIAYKTWLTTTNLHWGGVRWWFLCPLTTAGRSCGRRVRKLYLPPGGKYFDCRHCYDLTYQSCRDSHKYDGLINSMAASLGFPIETIRDFINSDTGIWDGLKGARAARARRKRRQH
jgi:hypothetical protein